jgi:hypothetical protein
MSAKNGDRSRFHRLRKKKIARRVKLRALAITLKTKTSE